MRVVVLGGGVIGVTSAYFLARAGHQVTLLERQASVALETSFANAGEVSPGYASPWAAPGVPRKAIRWLLMEHAPLILRPRWDPRLWRWLFATFTQCTDEAYVRNKRRMARLAEYSREQLGEIRTATGIQYDAGLRGTLQLFRTQKQIEGAARDIEVLRREGVAFELLDRSGCIGAEPGLAEASEPFAGGLRLPSDETGDCHKFATALAALAAEQGVRFRFGERLLGLDQRGDKIEAAITERRVVRGDVFVAALGSFTPGLVAPLGLRLPVYPVKGYSITANVEARARAPVSTILDETYKIAITRLGARIRVGGMAELAGFDDTLPPRRRETLVRSVASLFPGSGNWRSASFWSGLRPMTPDGTPIVGATPIANLYLNTGHGTLGWTMACGSARILSDQISGIAPEIETRDLSLARYAA